MSQSIVVSRPIPELRTFGSSTLKVRAAIAAVVLLYVLALLANYRYVIGEYFTGRGFSFSLASLGYINLTLFLTVLPVAWMPVNSNRPTVILYYFLYLIVYIPACVVPAFTEHAGAAALKLQLLLAASFAIVGLTYSFRTRDIHRLSLSRSEYLALIGCFTAITFAWIAQTIGVKLQIHRFADVYLVRDNYLEMVNSHSRLLVYLIGWQANVIGPLLMALAWIYRSAIFGFAAVLSQLWLYSITGYKSFLMAIPFVVVVFWLSKKRQPGSMMFTLGMLMLAMVVFCSVADLYFGGFDFSTVLVRRALLTPGRQSFYYFEFFSHNPKVMLSHSVLSGVFDYPYEVPPPRLIGRTYMGRYATNANGNLWADGFANFGMAGMFGASMILAAFCWVYDCVARRTDGRVAAVLLGMPLISLANSALLTTLLTHGLGLALVMLMLHPRNRTAAREIRARA